MNRTGSLHAQQAPALRYRAADPVKTAAVVYSESSRKYVSPSRGSATPCYLTEDTGLGDASTISWAFCFACCAVGVTCMTANWISVIVAAVFEVCWVIGLSMPTASWPGGGHRGLCQLLSVDNGRRASPSAVYAIFVGHRHRRDDLDIVLFGRPFKPTTLLLIAVLLAGVIGLNSSRTTMSKEG